MNVHKITGNRHKNKSQIKNDNLNKSMNVFRKSIFVRFINLGTDLKPDNNYMNGLNKTTIDKIMPKVKPSTAKRTRRKHKSKGERKINKLLRNLKNEPDNELRKLMEKRLMNIKAMQVHKSGRNKSKHRIDNTSNMLSVFKYTLAD